MILAALILVLLNAFFVSAEFGMVKLRHTRVHIIQQTYGLRGHVLAEVHKNLDAYLSACQLGITLASLGLGWIGEPAFAHLFEPIFKFFGIVSNEMIRLISFTAAFCLISFLHIVAGELMPKSLAIRQSEVISIWTAIPLYGFYWLMYPAIWLLNSCSNVLLRIAGLDISHDKENIHSTEEIRLILSASHLHGELSKEETDIIKHTLDFADLDVTDVMRPRVEMVMLDLQQPKDQLLETVLKYRYSRYPVYRSVIDDILGIIHIKDLIAVLYNDADNTDLSTIIRPVLQVSYRLPALDLLYKFRHGAAHFALVKNNRGRVVGFVTLDNLLHVLLGRMTDEFHKTKDDWSVNADGTIQVRGDCTIYSLEKALKREIDVDGDEEAVTLAGLILNRLGSLPKKGQRISFKEFTAVVEQVEGSKIKTVNITPSPEQNVNSSM